MGLKRVADEDVKAFSGLLGKVLPLQITGDPDMVCTFISLFNLPPKHEPA